MYVGDDDDILSTLTATWEDEDAAAGFEQQLDNSMQDDEDVSGFLAGDGRYHAVITEEATVRVKSSTDLETSRDAAELNEHGGPSRHCQGNILRCSSVCLHRGRTEAAGRALAPAILTR